MPNLYQDQSGVIRALVDRLGHDLEPSILIGGWATFVRVGGEISLDIDLITSQESRHKLEQLMTDLSPSNNHQGRKLRATIENQELPTMIGEAFDLIGTIIKLSKADQRLIAAVKKSWVAELQRRGAQPQTARPQL